MSDQWEIFDTDLISQILRGDDRAVGRLKATPPLCRRTTVLNEIELLQGRFQQFQGADTVERLIEAQIWLNRTRELLADFPAILEVDLRVGEIFFDLRRTKGLRKIGRRDLLIAAITLRHEAILVTGNIEHFPKVPRLKVVDWRSG